jgi:hypothetical protein
MDTGYSMTRAATSQVTMVIQCRARKISSWRLILIMPVDVLLLQVVFILHSKVMCSLQFTHGQYTLIPYDFNPQGRRTA